MRAVEYDSWSALGGGELSRRVRSVSSACASSSRASRSRAAPSFDGSSGALRRERSRFGGERLNLARHYRAIGEDGVERDEGAAGEIGQLAVP